MRARIKKRLRDHAGSYAVENVLIKMSLSGRFLAIIRIFGTEISKYSSFRETSRL